MQDRGKAVALLSETTTTTTNNNNKFFSSSSPDLPCPHHPSSSSVGICAYCLKDRLVKLVCSDCGEQRLSSCSCSDVSLVDIGSVGRVSFLIENDKDKERAHFTPCDPVPTAATTTANVVLKRSSSSTVDVKSGRTGSSKFWRFGRSLFRKKRATKIRSGDEGDDCKSEIWVSDRVGISRSKSVSAVRGSAPTTTNTSYTTTTATTASGLFDCHSEIGYGGLSTRVSDVNKDWHSETERRSGGFSKAKYGLGLIDIVDDDQDDYSAGFIDLKLSNGTDQFNESSESGFRLSKESDFSEMLVESQLFDQYPQFYNCGGSCRITVNDHCNNYSEMKKKCKKRSKVWKWMLKNQSSSASTVNGRD